jgi:hypothetical protein
VANEDGVMALEEAHFWIALTIFGSGIYLVRDEPWYGGPLVLVGTVWLIYALRRHFRPRAYQLWIVLVVMGCAIALTGYDVWSRREVAPSIPASTPSVDIDAATATIRAERDRAIQERDDARGELAAVTKQRDAQSQMVAALQAKLNSLRSDNKDAARVDAIRWIDRLLFYSGGDKTIKYIVLYGSNDGREAQKLKSATLSSMITGAARSFSVEVPAHRTDGEQVQIQNLNAVPAGAQIELIMEWSPPISIVDFMGQWGKVKLEIDDAGSSTHIAVFDRDDIASMLSQDIVGAAEIVGAPRVTPKTP